MTRDAARRAGIMCNSPEFQKFAALRSGLPNTQFCASAAAEYLRTVCKVASRTQLNTDPAAALKFDHLRTEFDAWRGRIAPQRR